MARSGSNNEQEREVGCWDWLCGSDNNNEDKIQLVPHSSSAQHDQKTSATVPATLSNPDELISSATKERLQKDLAKYIKERNERCARSDRHEDALKADLETITRDFIKKQKELKSADALVILEFTTERDSIARTMTKWNKEYVAYCKSVTGFILSMKNHVRSIEDNLGIVNRGFSSQRVVEESKRKIRELYNDKTYNLKTYGEVIGNYSNRCKAYDDQLQQILQQKATLIQTYCSPTPGAPSIQSASTSASVSTGIGVSAAVLPNNSVFAAPPGGASVPTTQQQPPAASPPPAPTK